MLIDSPAVADAAIEALLTERTRTAAAARANISMSTLRRLLACPDFQVRLAAARERLLNSRLDRLLEPVA